MKHEVRKFKLLFIVTVLRDISRRAISMPSMNSSGE
jgi:hypothetical protein